MTALFLLPLLTMANPYSATRVTEDGVPIIVLRDDARRMEVRIAPTIGNNAYDFTVHGRRVLWSPYKTVGEFKAKPVQLGNPFLAPWANRIGGSEYWINGKKYILNDALGNFRRDNNRNPIHGLLGAAPWEVTKLEANATHALVTSRLEYWRNPQWMAQFPFAHTYEMTYRLANGELEVDLKVDNLSTEPLPLSLGFHTYYQLSDSKRDEWRVHIPAREHLVPSKELIPTGERMAMQSPDPYPLAGHALDDGYTALIRDEKGRATFWVEGKKERIEVVFGPHYPVAIVWAPPGREFMCFEPMTSVTNAFNLAHQGVFPNLETVAPGQSWRESFWIRPVGW
jgi:aldose 1-epimerase